ncbi:hypothetical protein ABT354_12920 [Streptomyces sp. NPDC000594]|uniref:hypothetical protein n=1 Tax=Streptomyces sp. NPDC000594 TaxID=3154261 RepID=UPI00331FF21D
MSGSRLSLGWARYGRRATLLLLPAAITAPVVLVAGWELGVAVCATVLAYLPLLGPPSPPSGAGGESAAPVAAAPGDGAPADGAPAQGPGRQRPEDREHRLNRMLATALDDERGTALALWGEDESLRGLPTRVLLGLRITHDRIQVDPLRPEPRSTALPPAGHTPQELGAFYLDQARRATRGPLRAVVTGDPGSGKSTLALLLTLGALREPGGTLFPLLLQAASWNPEDQRKDLSHWVAEQALRLFPSLRPVEAEAGEDFPRLLVGHPSVWTVLDGPEELPETQWEEAWIRLGAFGVEHPLLVLTRPGFLEAVHRTPAPAVPELPEFRIEPCEPARVARYLRELTVRPGHPPAGEWGPVIERLESADPGGIGELLRTPLHLDLAWRQYGDRAPGVLRAGLPPTPADLVARADTDLPGLREELMAAFLDAAFALRPPGRPGLRARPRDGRARRSVRHPVPLPGGRSAPYRTAWLVGRTAGQDPAAGAIAWWRLDGLVNTAVPVAACGVLLVLTYVLALFMPVGVTRGLAIGCTTVVTLELLRYRGPHRAAERLTALLAGTAVAALGLARYGPAGVLDGLQLGTVLLLVLRFRAGLTGEPARTALLTAVGVCAATGGVMTVPLLLGAELPEGGQGVNVFLSMLTGVGLATLACRTLAAPFGAPPEPTRVNFSDTPGVERLPAALVRGILPAFAIGASAGASLAFQFPPAYAAALVWGFGLVLGVPVGTVAGLLFWYRRAKPLGRAASARGSLRNDRLVLLCCVLGLTLLCTAVMAVLDLGFQIELERRSGEAPLELRIQHGTLFGLALGLILGACYTATPRTLVAHVWLVFRGRLPWRLGTFLGALHQREILRQTGNFYRVRHDGLAHHLVKREDEYRCLR